MRRVVLELREDESARLARFLEDAAAERTTSRDTFTRETFPTVRALDALALLDRVKEGRLVEVEPA